MSNGSKLYEGKAKILYTTDDPDVVLVHFKDEATAFNAQKRGQIVGKGEMNCAISTQLLGQLVLRGIATHFLDRPAPNQMRVQAVTIIPLEVVVRNQAAGSLCRETGLPLGQHLSQPLVEFYYKNDTLGDPLLTPDRIQLLHLAPPQQVEQLRVLALKINAILLPFLAECGIILVDFKLEFGLNRQQEILLADEISPDTCRLWDATEVNPKDRVLDKDRFRHDLGNVEVAYQKVLERVLAQGLEP